MHQHSPITIDHKYLSFAMLLVLVLSLLPIGVSAEEDPLVGTWYGHDVYPDGYQVQRISRRGANGSISIEFRQYENCLMISRSVEKGTWRRKDNIEIVEITSIDGAPSTNIDHYEIVEVSMQGAKSMHVESGMYFSYQRVSPDFEFPDCELFS